jgi:replicative DNA helicase
MSSIPAQFQGSAALQFIIQQGWTWKQTDSVRIVLGSCPYCKKEDHCYMEIHGDGDEQKNRDGLYLCQRCGKSGNLYSLKQHLGMTIPGVASQKDWGNSEKKIDPLPDTEECHIALLNDEDALEYLMDIRGFSLEIIKKQKIGLTKHYFKMTGKDTRALIYPYLVNGNTVWAHFRTLPDPKDLKKVPKDFASPTGWDAALYNGEILKDGLKDIVLVEGEPNCIAAMDKGISNICGVPGANLKKAEWIETFDKIGLEKIYLLYDKDKVGQKAAQTLASRIGIERCFKIILPDFYVTTESGETRLGKDLNEWFVSGGGTPELFEQLKADAVLFDVDGVSSANDALDEFTEELDNKGAGQKYIWPLISELIQFDEGDVVDILAEEKQGKFLSIDSKILMEDGTWKRNGDLKIGDRLASIDGQFNSVTGIFPQGKKPLMKCTFADGRSVLAGKPHLWSVQSVNHWEDGYKIFTTDAIQHHHCNKQHHNAKVYIPTISGKFGNTPVPINGWILGCLIGDGGLTGTSPRLTTTDEEIARSFQVLLRDEDCEINAIGKNREKWANGQVQASKKLKEFSISGKNGINKITDKLKALKLYGCDSLNKFIPKEYLQADCTTRWQLLQGLMDTDGTVSNKYGTPSYCTISKQLAEDFVYLVRSLGGIAKISKPKKTKFRYKGKLVRGQDAYIIIPRFEDKSNLFTLNRKRKKVQNQINKPRLTFDKIEEAGEHDALCISVSHPSKLYITDDFIVTHNTTFGLNLIEYMVDTYGDDGIIICGEMTRAKLARKWVCHKAGIADNLPKTPEEAAALTALFKDAIPSVKEMAANRPGTLYLCYPKYSTMDDIYKLMIDCIRRYGVKWIMLDNLQRFCDMTKGNRNRTEWLSEISKRTSQIAKDYNTQLIRILQPHRVGENHLTSVSSVDGASQIAKDCDGMLILNRNRVGGVDKNTFQSGAFVESNVTFSPETLVTCAISRYSAGGETQVWCDGATSTFSKLSEGKIKSMMNTGTGVLKGAAEANKMPLDALKEATNWENVDGDIVI